MMEFLTSISSATATAAVAEAGPFSSFISGLGGVLWVVLKCLMVLMAWLLLLFFAMGTNGKVREFFDDLGLSVQFAGAYFVVFGLDFDLGNFGWFSLLLAVPLLLGTGSTLAMAIWKLLK